jgi:hypothetical protein
LFRADPEFAGVPERTEFDGLDAIIDLCDGSALMKATNAANNGKQLYEENASIDSHRAAPNHY